MIPRLILTLLFFCGANCFYWIWQNPILLAAALPALLIPNLVAGFFRKKIPTKRLKCCNHGLESLYIFTVSAVLSIITQLALLTQISTIGWKLWALSAVWAFVANAILFWNGILFVYCTSTQLGLKHRVIGIICGPIPIVHLFALHHIIRIVRRELRTETEKAALNQSRQHLQICKTKYPILMVHGVFFRDNKAFNYWGRVPSQLEENGATIYYGEHQSALSIAASAEELAARIRGIIEKEGCEKVNIIAHSKGGLDCRYAIAHCGIAPYVASLTTINTPHQGCGFAEYLLEKVPQGVRDRLAETYNHAAAVMGDTSPDFMAAVQDLTAARCQKTMCDLYLPEHIYTQSVGSVLKGSTSGKFPLNFSQPLVKYFDGPNDGLVAATSFRWGEDYQMIVPKGNRGISHGDMIDLNREDIEGFDVREFYVQLVSKLREKGL